MFFPVFLLAVFSGLGVFAALIGFVNDTVRSTIDGINEGQSKIAESGHTLILGWNDKILPIVDQLCLANEDCGGKPIVVMSEMDKPEMDGFLRLGLAPRRVLVLDM